MTEKKIQTTKKQTFSSSTKTETKKDSGLFTALQKLDRAGGTGRPELDELLVEICKKIGL